MDFSHILPALTPGSVWLVGAGPGNIGLISVLGIHAISKADIIVYDALINKELLTLAKDNALKIYAGKRGGKPSNTQNDISETLIKYARLGKTIVRLKGGDPMIFGRGWEEISHLAENDIPFRVIPGITSGIAAATYAGIPLTHRELSSSVSFVTGHGANGELPHNINWEALASGSEVIVFYMAHQNIKLLKHKLINANRPKNDSVALIENASLDSQVIVTGKLDNLDILAKQVSPPMIVVIGKTVDIRRNMKNHYE